MFRPEVLDFTFRTGRLSREAMHERVLAASERVLIMHAFVSVAKDVEGVHGHGDEGLAAALSVQTGSSGVGTCTYGVGCQCDTPSVTQDASAVNGARQL
jgi:hypothetical protein